MDVDDLISLAERAQDREGVAAAGGDSEAAGSAPGFRNLRGKFAALCRWRGNSGDAGDARNKGLRNIEMRAQVAWTNRKRATTDDFKIELAEKRAKVRGTGKWKQRTGEQVCEILSTSLDLSCDIALALCANTVCRLTFLHPAVCRISSKL